MYRVELKAHSMNGIGSENGKFLMYRVELKALGSSLGGSCLSGFLMYRVELKEGIEQRENRTSNEFLMYRVELKASLWTGTATTAALVPNVPCGVESQELLERLLRWRGS